MSNLEYLNGRRKYQRPQAMLWADNRGTIEQGYYLPSGIEIGSDGYSGAGSSFITLSDDNRSEIDFSNERIENRKRTVNGRMRSYYIADKLTISTSWEMLPSRSFALYPEFRENLFQGPGTSPYSGNTSLEYTSDGGAGGNEILDWYEKHTGSFWLYLAYDKYPNFINNDEDYQDIEQYNLVYGNLKKYNQVLEVFFSDFSYSVVKRGGSNFDFWNISVTMEEV